MTKKRNIFIALTLLLLLAAIAVSSVANIKGAQQGTDSFGLFTFNREMRLPGGRVVRFFESGDLQFNYYHDSDGFILIKQDGDLYYAVNDNGRPKASNVRYTAGRASVNRLPKMLAAEIDFAANQDLITEYPVEEDCTPEAVLFNAPQTEAKAIANIIIYIVFNDDNPNDYVHNPVAPLLSGSNPSLSDYFYLASDGSIIVNNFYPQNGSQVYVYKAPQNRSYYNVAREDTAKRGKREAELLTGAVNSASAKFIFNNASLDTNSDGFIDSVGFIIGGSSEASWGGLLWPHSWNLASINKSYNSSASAKINGIEVGSYSFNFVDAINVGVLCHEFFHVLGAPDLYHYSVSDFVPVGDWDLMQFNKNIPQLPLTYMRTKYLGVSSNRVGEILHNGVYSLSPTVSASNQGFFAYKIPTGVAGQYFMVEYRSNTASATYDSQLPASGLVAYRIKEGVAEGNQNAVYQNPAKPDEVYVFRPRVESTGKETTNELRYARSKADVAYAALSPYNTYFSSVGYSLESKPNASYDYTTLFYINGANSGIIIEALSITDSRIEFRVKLDGESSIDDNYFDDKITLTDAQLVNGEYAGANVAFTVGDIELSYLKDISIKLKSASGGIVAENKLNLSKFRTQYEGGERRFKSIFAVNDKGFAVSGVFDCGSIDGNQEPVFAELSVTDGDNDSKVLDSVMIAKPVSWQEVLDTRAELTASIDAASRITLGVRKDGTVQHSGDGTTGQWDVGGYTNIIRAAAGMSHSLLLNTQRRVVSVGSNDFGEANVASWQDIVLIEAGYKTSLAVNLQGRVFAVGDNSYGQLNVTGWSNIVSISSGVRHTAGVDRFGKVFAAGANSNNQLDVGGISGASAAACGNTFTAVLLQNGKVAVAGFLAGAEVVSGWTDVVKISAGENFLIALRADKTVLAAGVNDAGQCLVEGLEDIIDVAAGEYHSAFLRVDGIVLYRGSDNGEYKVKSGLGNLIYDNYVAPESISFDISRKTIYTGIQNEMSLALCTSSVLPSSTTYKKIVYTSSDPAVATVTPNGAVWAVSPGVATITAKVSGSSISSDIEITVKEYIAITRIKFVDENITVVTGNSISLMIAVEPVDATVLGEVIYYTESGLAAIDSKGVLTAGGNYGTLTVTALLSQNGTTYTASCTVNVVSTVAKIEIISLPTKTVYRYDEDFDVTGGKIRITYIDNSTSIQSVTPLMISGYNKRQCTSQTITVSYMQASASFSIAVNNYVKSVTLRTVGKTEYVFGESITLAGVTVSQKWADDKITATPLPVGTAVSGYDGSIVGVQTVTLSFVIDGIAYQASYEVLVQDIAEYISGDAIIKTNYLLGEQLSSAESILVYMASGAQKTITLADTAISGYNPYICGVQRVQIAYQDPISKEVCAISCDFTVELIGQVDVYSIDNLGGRHLYMPPDYIYYNVGDELDIGVAFSLADGRQIEIGRDTSQPMYYTVESFNNLKYEQGTAIISVNYKNSKRTAGGGLNVVTEVINKEIEVFGDTKITIRQITGATTYLYGETPQFYVYTSDQSGNMGGGEPNKIEYDKELTDTVQTCYIYYRNIVSAIDIIIKDYLVGFQPIGDIEVLFGDDTPPIVMGIMAKGGIKQLVASEYGISGWNTSALGTKTVTVTSGSVSIAFGLTVIDAIASINVKTAIADTCKFGHSPDLSASFDAVMLSGAKTVIYYNQNEFTVSDFDNRLLATQAIKMKHKATGKEFSFDVTVINYVAGIKVAAGAKVLYNFGQSLELDVVTTMATGLTGSVNLSDCRVTGYNKYVLGAQTVTIAYQDATTTLKVTVVDTVAALKLDRAPFRTGYSYGEALSYLGGVLSVEYLSGDKQTYKEDAINTIVVNSYNPLTVGKQVITLSFGGAAVSYNVTVAAKQADTYSLGNKDLFTQKEKAIVLSRTATGAELKASLTIASYLTARIKTADGKYMTLDAAKDKNLRSDYTLQIINGAEFAVFSYKILLKGDADANGILDERDVAALADRLVSQSFEKDVVDYDGDGTFSLTDFVNWARKLSLPQEGPVNRMANSFICDGKKREEAV